MDFFLTASNDKICINGIYESQYPLIMMKNNRQCFLSTISKKQQANIQLTVNACVIIQTQMRYLKAIFLRVKSTSKFSKNYSVIDVKN
jgi:hypothetical protein